jgi:hypothetical protein
LRLAVNGDDAASEGVTFRSGHLGAVARNSKESAGKDEGDQKSTESMFVHVVNTLTPRETLVPCLHVVRGAASVKSSVRSEGQAFDRGDRREEPQRARRKTVMILLCVLSTLLFLAILAVSFPNSPDFKLRGTPWLATPKY